MAESQESEKHRDGSEVQSMLEFMGDEATSFMAVTTAAAVVFED
jgi:hypothetical protein